MVRMGVRLLQKTDLDAITTVPPENSATLENSAITTNSSSCDSAPQTPGPFPDASSSASSAASPFIRLPFHSQVSTSTCSSSVGGSLKCNKAERCDSFSKLKLSPKAFRFTGKLCRSKSEIERDSPDASYALNPIEVSSSRRFSGSVPSRRLYRLHPPPPPLLRLLRHSSATLSAFYVLRIPPPQITHLSPCLSVYPSAGANKWSPGCGRQTVSAAGRACWPSCVPGQVNLRARGRGHCHGAHTQRQPKDSATHSGGWILAQRIRSWSRGRRRRANLVSHLILLLLFPVSVLLFVFFCHELLTDSPFLCPYPEGIRHPACGRVHVQ